MVHVICYILPKSSEICEDFFHRINDQLSEGGEARPNTLRCVLKHMNHTRIYVGDLSAEVTESDLQRMFTQYGHVESISLVRNSTQLHAFAFVEMQSPEDARTAAQGMNGQVLNGHKLICYTVPPKSRPRTAVRP
jgi:hypothetical protein